MKKLILLISVCSILTSCSVNSPQINRTNEDELRTIIQKVVDEYNLPGVQVCVKDKQLNTVKIALGNSDLENRNPMLNSTQIKIGSMTKSFTAIAILRLAQKGLIDLNEKISSYIFIENENYKDITVLQLMNMHSGLRGYLNDDDTDYFVNKVIANPNLQFTPNELIDFAFQITDEQGKTIENQFHYNNSNYILLGMLIEKVSGSSYAEFIEREIIVPLELSTTYVPVDNNFSTNVSSGYHIENQENIVTNYSAIDLSYVWSAGCIISTASDLCDWITLLSDKQIPLGNFENYIDNGLTLEDDIKYTAGVINEPEIIWHNGTVLGYHGEMCYIKSSGIAITVLSNCTIADSEEDPIKIIMKEIINMLEKGNSN